MVGLPFRCWGCGALQEVQEHAELTKTVLPSESHADHQKQKSDLHRKRTVHIQVGRLQS
ncbi:hypothetical protein SLEP1_g10774 [Rubroshorea leprosula]|uniref:Uncharacterized protein n=1 Tax=Rubroshorea leprosula TaxID=152421 RepID=A0AAV5IK09_9ROSI|nr:hypothetical protein SLEP1_g10774 [Rubroshorea leprosula]